MQTAKLGDFEERFAELSGVRLRYFVAGAGRPLVLVHGLGGGAANWSSLAPALARTRRVLVPDLPGHAGSGPFPERPELDDYARVLAALAEHEGMLPADFVGHSFGGSTSLRVAIARPDAVRSIVLAAAAGISSSRRLAQVTLPLFGASRPGRVLTPFRGRIAARPVLRYGVFSWWGAADPPAMSTQAVEGFLAPYSLHVDTLSAGLALLREDPRAQLDRVRCPVLVLWGARDHQVGIADAFEYARRLRAQLRVIADCGHLLIGERADACLDAIESFLDRVRDVDEFPVEPELLADPSG